MPKTAVQTPICDICGADVRDGSLFCYNCGGSLKLAVAEEPKPLQEPTAKPSTATNGAGKAEIPEPKNSRQRRRPLRRGPVEIVWEPKSGFSISYIVGAIVLLTFALLLFIAAMLLK